MRKTFVILLSFIACSASAQISFNSGSVRLDRDLNTINASASANFGDFIVDLIGSYNVSENKIEYMKGQLEMAPAEIYLALELSDLSHLPIDNVLRIHERNKSKGWGYTAKEVGIKPGSPEFHRLKDNAVSKKNKGHEKGEGHGKNQGNGKNKEKKQNKRN
ncbi:hypothetical protein [Mangrovibacterium lignilyticum]|uniref:hypothetical protein n=1 Tax=Mangrovibacterium lignilyticum TaxID=2668052 RepID=UPI0013D7BC76|nr:hypothetical protein [Mangrovibacterium lignilyticum]